MVSHAPARARQGASHPTTSERLDAIQEEARELSRERRRRYVAARCTGYSPDAALRFATAGTGDPPRLADEITRGHRNPVRAVGWELIDPLPELAPVHQVAGQLELPSGGDQ